MWFFSHHVYSGFYLKLFIPQQFSLRHIYLFTTLTLPLCLFMKLTLILSELAGDLDATASHFSQGAFCSRKVFVSRLLLFVFYHNVACGAKQFTPAFMLNMQGL